MYILNWYRLYFTSKYVLGDYCLHFASNEIGPKIQGSFDQQIQLIIVCVIVSLLVFYNLKRLIIRQKSKPPKHDCYRMDSESWNSLKKVGNVEKTVQYLS